MRRPTPSTVQELRFAMKVKSRSTFHPKAVIAEAEAGRLSLTDLRREIRNAERFNSREALSVLRGIEQRMLGEKASLRLSNTHSLGTAAWAYAELGAVPKTPYSWAALDPEGRVVINIWDDREGWSQDEQGRWCPAHPYGARGRPDPAKHGTRPAKGTRTEFFKLLEVATASHGGIVRAVISTAEDINANPRKRVNGSNRPWLNEDGSPVFLRVNDLDLRRESFSFALVDDTKRPRSPFADNGPRLDSLAEDKMLRRYSQLYPGIYFLEVQLGERRVDAVRIPSGTTRFYPGGDFRVELAEAEGVEAIEVKRGELRRSIIDQVIGSAAALGAIPVAIVEKASAERLGQMKLRHPTMRVWTVTGAATLHHPPTASS